MDGKLTGRGGPGRGQGRKKMDPDDRRVIEIKVRFTQDEMDKFEPFMKPKKSEFIVAAVAEKVAREKKSRE